MLTPVRPGGARLRPVGHRYVFRSTWHLDAPVADVTAALEEVGSYPAWWPEVREATRIDEDTYELRCRSTLPYDLVFETRRSVHDTVGGVLEANMIGDLEGFSRWTISADPLGAGTVAVFDEDVVANKRLLRVLEPVARPGFRANHWLMMRHGEAGLRVYLAGLRHGRTIGA
jgi:hypothetical protein